jgi:drug/metabolite transporter (DMT)-like permease
VLAAGEALTRFAPRDRGVGLLLVPDPSSSRRLGIGAVCVAIVGLSLGSTMVKTSHLPGPVMGFWRLALGGLAWHLILFVSNRRSGKPAQRFISKQALLLTLTPGIAFGINLSFFFTAVTKTSIAHTEFLGGLTPLLLVPIAKKRLGERVPRDILALGAVALGGIALIILTRTSTTSSPARLSGDILVLGAVTTWTYYLLRSRIVRASISTTEFMTGMTTFAALTVLPIAIVRHGLTGTGSLTHLPARGLLMIVLMSISSGIVSHGMIAWAQKRVPVSTISIMQTAQPGIATFWAWLLLDQGVGPWQVIGMIVVMVAIGAVAVRSSRG